MINIKTRHTDHTDSIPLRTDRFFAINARWFFSTREGASVGPYFTKEDARDGLNAFIEFISIAPSETKERFLSKYLSL